MPPAPASWPRLRWRILIRVSLGTVLGARLLSILSAWVSDPAAEKFLPVILSEAKNPGVDRTRPRERFLRNVQGSAG